jgi:hypothetical protein
MEQAFLLLYFFERYIFIDARTYMKKCSEEKSSHLCRNNFLIF